MALRRGLGEGYSGREGLAAAGVLAWEDGGRLTGARARQHDVGPLPMAPGPGRWFEGDEEEVLSWSQQRRLQLDDAGVNNLLQGLRAMNGVVLARETRV